MMGRVERDGVRDHQKLSLAVSRRARALCKYCDQSTFTISHKVSEPLISVADRGRERRLQCRASNQVCLQQSVQDMIECDAADVAAAAPVHPGPYQEETNVPLTA